MRYPQQLTADRHQTILREAARLFRECGLDGVGVAEIMKAAHLTHGGFYAHFDSKVDLVAEAAARAAAETLGHVDRAAASAKPVETLREHYLSDSHRDNPGNGCAFAALAPEIARQPDRVRSAFTGELENVIARLAETFPFRTGADPRAEAIRLLSSLVGALALARATNNLSLSDEILTSVREQGH